MIFASKSINHTGHFLVGTEWVYAKGVVTMHEEGFSCTCMKQPRRKCNHIINVNARMLGAFDEEYNPD